MKEKNQGAPINQDEIYHYLKDIRKIKVMTPDREKELAVKMKSDEISDRERKRIEEEVPVLQDAGHDAAAVLARLCGQGAGGFV